MKNITVGKLIEDLQKCDPEMLVAFHLCQANKVGPVCEPSIATIRGASHLHAASMDGSRVSIYLNLPSDDETFTIISVRKK